MVRVAPGHRGDLRVALDEPYRGGTTAGRLDGDASASSVQVEEADAGQGLVPARSPVPHHDTSDEKTASRTRSLVGRVRSPGGAASRCL